MEIQKSKENEDNSASPPSYIETIRSSLPLIQVSMDSVLVRMPLAATLLSAPVENGDYESNRSNNNFSEIEARHHLVMKVYIILSMQLLISYNHCVHCTFPLLASSG